MKFVDPQWLSEQIGKFGVGKIHIAGTGYEGDILSITVKGKEYRISIEEITTEE